jgi:hypothetical protein
MFFTDTLAEWLTWQTEAVNKDKAMFADKLVSSYLPRVRYPSKPPILLPMLVSGFVVEPFAPLLSVPHIRDTESKQEATSLATATEDKEDVVYDDPKATPSPVISLGDSQRLIKAVSLLASDRVPIAVKRLPVVSGRHALRPMVPSIATWLSREPFTLERALCMPQCSGLERVAERFDELFAELVALRTT